MLSTIVAVVAVVALLGDVVDVAHSASLKASGNKTTTKSSSSTAGVPLWIHNFTTPQAAVNPTVFAGVAYVPTNTSLYAFTIATGALVFKMDFIAGDVGGYVAVDERYLYVGTFEYLYSLNRDTGATIWTYRRPFGPRGPQMRPSIGLQGVYVTTSFTPLIKIHHVFGTPIWTAPPSLGNAQLHATESAVGGFVFVVNLLEGADGVSYATCLSATDGSYQWRVAGVRNIIVSDITGLLFCLQEDSSSSNISSFQLQGGRAGRSIVLPPKPLDYYSYRSTMYVANNAMSPTDVLKVDIHTNKIIWTIPNVPFQYFVPSALGIVVFGLSEVTAYSEYDGSMLWRFPAVAVNDGAVSVDNTLIMITQYAVIALPIA